MTYFKHDTAIVDDDSNIGIGTKIWHWTHVCAETEIGNSVTIGQNCYIGPKTKIGPGCKIQNNVSVYEGVQLHADVFCGPSVVFTNVINPRSAYDKKDEFKSTIVKTGASLGANSTIICGVTIGKFAFVGAGSVVTKSVPDYALVVGNPAKQVGTVDEVGCVTYFKPST